MNTNDLIDAVSRTFPTFGGGKSSDWNPITRALMNQPPIFAAGVSVSEVVDFIINYLADHEYVIEKKDP